MSCCVRGSGKTVTVCVCVSPLTVTATLYVPGTTSGPRFGSKNSLGGASLADATRLGPSYRRFQTCRLIPSFAGAQSVATAPPFSSVTTILTASRRAFFCSSVCLISVLT